MDLPPHVFFAATLEHGTVYYFDSDRRLGTARPHYHVVLSADPDRILLVAATSKIEQRRRFLVDHNCPPETLVLASPSSEPYLRCESAFDCNRLVVESLQSLTKRYARRPFGVKGPASACLVQHLNNGVVRSPLVARMDQDVLRAENSQH